METRRSFFRKTALAAGAAAVSPILLSGNEINHSGMKKNPVSEDLFFDISLAQWSLQRKLKAGKLDNLDFPG